MKRFAEADLPTRFGSFRLVVYRPTGALNEPVDDQSYSLREHSAVCVGPFAEVRAPLVRVHSECFTGEVLHSLRCDCQAQLEAALRRIQSEGCGVVIYLRQEGRGIGLGNKVRAYELQDGGADTVDANLQLGFGSDDREYSVACDILRDLGIGEVTLMTNNPRKVSMLEEGGIRVAAREPHHIEPNEINRNYLEVKRRKMGHLPP